MVFKRRDRRSVLRVVSDFLYPPGGWNRAFQYVKHRVRRLPDSPERIARGIWAGVFVTFTPLYGLHFIVAVILAHILRGNLVASLMATFFGNPLTYVPIGLVSLQTGYWILGREYIEGTQRSLVTTFVDAWLDLKQNLLALFSNQSADWAGLQVFFAEVFLPYLLGGILPGFLTASLIYFMSVPLIRAYQKRRRGVIKTKLLAIKKKRQRKARKVDQI